MLPTAAVCIFVIATCLCLTLILLCSGCAGLFIKPYGFAASDAEKIRRDGSAVFIPGNAPSISQGYNPDPMPRYHLDKSYDHRGIEVDGSHDHTGIDIFAKKGTPVLAVASGVVTGSYYEPFYGNHVEMNFGRNTEGLLVKGNFFHLDERLVKEGDEVTRGQQIGTLGSTGLLASYPHLHYEIRLGDLAGYFEATNPHWYWADGVGIVTCFDTGRKWPDEPFQTTYPVPCRGVNWQ
jgi:murein DD-endopeptidase MepM/ murein hydrolase activator NlpD